MTTMRTLIVLSLLTQVLPFPRPPHPVHHPVTCDDKGVQEASEAVEKYIALHHHHGYKYRLTKTIASKLQKTNDTFCELHLELELEETNCHVVNPKPLKECELRQMSETKVQSNCNVTVTVVNGISIAIKYSCKSEPASAEELVKVCPDCPSLLSLTDPKGLESIKEAMKKFHAETNETNYWKILDVGRISTQYMFQGQSYFAEFAIVETQCLRQDNPEEDKKCRMLGKEEVRFGFCTSTLLGDGEITVDCDIYEAQNTTGHHHHHHHHHHFHHGAPGERHHGPHFHDGPPPHPAGPHKHPGDPTEHHGGPPGHPHGHPHGPPKPPHGVPEHHDGHPPVLTESSEHPHPHVCHMPSFTNEKIHPIRPFPQLFTRPGFKGCPPHTIPPTANGPGGPRQI